MKQKILAALGVAFNLALAAGATSATQPAAPPAASPRAQARLEPLAAPSVAGTVDLIQQDDGVVVTARLTGLTPGLHAFHVHQHGSCDHGGQAAGAHFDASADSGRGERVEHHGGAFGALTADQDGVARLSVRLPASTLVLAGPRGVVGRSIVVHTSPDDYAGTPGQVAAKGRILACGVIRAAGNA